MNKLLKIFNLCVLRKTLFIFVAMGLCATTVFAQGISVSGTVTDDMNEPLPGASVQVKGTSAGNVTDANGKFTITVPNRNAVLVFSYVGFTPQEITVGTRTTINVTLQESTVLEDVVVTALGIKRATKALSYSATEKRGDEIEGTPELNVMNSMQGLIAGVDITATGSGIMGSSSIQIRGATTVSGGGNPLYVIDGTPMNRNSRSSGGRDYGDALTTINPADIETINVLKGAAATALYGSSASNGVVLITTKSGTVNRRGLGITYSTALSTESYVSPLRGRQRLYGNSGANGDNTDAYLSQWNAEVHRNWGPRYDGRQLTTPSGSPLYWNDDQTKPMKYEFMEDHWNEFMQPALTATNSISLQGGSNTQNYRISFSDLRVREGVPNSNANRQTMMISTNTKIGQKVTLGARMNYSTTSGKNRPNPQRYIQILALIPTNLDINWLKGDPNKWGAKTDGSGKMLPFSTNDYYQNPWWSAYQDYQEDLRNRLNTSADLRVEILPWLFFTSRIGIDSETFRLESYEADGFERGGNNGRGSVSQSIYMNETLNFEWTFLFNRKLSIFDVSAFVGGNARRNHSLREGSSGQAFVIPFWNVMNNTTTQSAIAEDSRSGVNSLLGQAEISYKNMVYLTVTGRNDWFSSLNPEAKNNVFYPSIGLSYLLSEQFKLPQWWNFAKIRGTYAETGGGASAYATKMTYNFDSQGYMGIPFLSIPGTLANPYLMPYKTREYEGGVDFRFLKNRVTIDYTYYDKKSFEDIVSVTTPQSTGYSSARDNLGSMGNKGHELMVGVIPVQNRTLEWRLNFVYSYNMGKVLDLGGVAQLNRESNSAGGGIDLVNIVGEAPLKMFGYKQREVDGQKVWEQFRMQNPATGGTTGRPAEYYYVWYPTREPDKQHLGYGFQPNSGSISTSLKYKRFTVSAMIDAKWGGTVVYVGEQEMIERGLSVQTLPGRDGGLFLEGVYNTGTSANPVYTNLKDAPTYVLHAYPGNYLAGDVTVKGNEVPYHLKFFEQYYREGNVKRISDMVTFDGSWVKFRTVSVSYNIPRSAFGNVPIQNANVSLIARNLFDLYNKLPSGDPSTGGAGINSFAMPALRSFAFNLSVSF